MVFFAINACSHSNESRSATRKVAYQVISGTALAVSVAALAALAAMSYFQGLSFYFLAAPGTTAFLAFADTILLACCLRKAPQDTLKKLSLPIPQPDGQPSKTPDKAITRKAALALVKSKSTPSTTLSEKTSVPVPTAQIPQKPTEQEPTPAVIDAPTQPKKPEVTPINADMMKKAQSAQECLTLLSQLSKTLEGKEPHKRALEKRLYMDKLYENPRLHDILKFCTADEFSQLVKGMDSKQLVGIPLPSGEVIDCEAKKEVVRQIYPSAWAESIGEILQRAKNLDSAKQDLENYFKSLSAYESPGVLIYTLLSELDKYNVAAKKAPNKQGFEAYAKWADVLQNLNRDGAYAQFLQSSENQKVGPFVSLFAFLNDPGQIQKGRPICKFIPVFAASMDETLLKQVGSHLNESHIQYILHELDYYKLAKGNSIEKSKMAVLLLVYNNQNCPKFTEEMKDVELVENPKRLRLKWGAFIKLKMDAILGESSFASRIEKIKEMLSVEPETTFKAELFANIVFRHDKKNSNASTLAENFNFLTEMFIYLPMTPENEQTLLRETYEKTCLTLYGADIDHYILRSQFANLLYGHPGLMLEILVEWKKQALFTEILRCCFSGFDGVSDHTLLAKKYLTFLIQMDYFDQLSVEQKKAIESDLLSRITPNNRLKELIAHFKAIMVGDMRIQLDMIDNMNPPLTAGTLVSKGHPDRISVLLSRWKEQGVANVIANELRNQPLLSEEYKQLQVT